MSLHASKVTMSSFAEVGDPAIGDPVIFEPT
jgi:hypothetical protein